MSFVFCFVIFFFKQKTAYEMRISDWSSDVCSSDLQYSEDEIIVTAPRLAGQLATDIRAEAELDEAAIASYGASSIEELLDALEPPTRSGRGRGGRPVIPVNARRLWGFGRGPTTPNGRAVGRARRGQEGEFLVGT